jgi:hypothetical protein
MLIWRLSLSLFSFQCSQLTGRFTRLKLLFWKLWTINLCLLTIKVYLLLFYQIRIDWLSSRYGFRCLTLVWFLSYFSNDVNLLVCPANFHPLFFFLLVSHRTLSSALYFTTYTLTRFMIHLLVTVSMIINIYWYIHQLITIRNIYRFGSPLIVLTNVGLSPPCWPALLKREDGVRLTGWSITIWRDRSHDGVLEVWLWTCL